MTPLKTILSFTDFLTEANKGGYSDEHALVHVWNHVSGTNKNAMHEAEKAKKDPNHPLSFKKAEHGFTGGEKQIHHKEAYHKEIDHAARAVESMKKHPEFAKSHKNGEKAEVKGASRGKLSDTWREHGAGNATSKEDIRIGKHAVSLKKGDSQLMSAEHAETKAVYHHATGEAVKNKHMSHEQAQNVRKKIAKVAGHLESMKHTTSEEEKRKHRDAAQKHIDEIHSSHPHLIHHVAHEASTGHGKFGGEGSEGSARFLVTTTHHGDVHVHDTKSNNEPIVHGNPRVALPKGSGRPGNLKLDYRVKHTLKGKP